MAASFFHQISTKILLHRLEKILTLVLFARHIKYLLEASASICQYC
jgi:hypothetical protein